MMKKGKQIFLSPFLKEDRLILFEWINNKELVEFNSVYKPVSRESHDSWFENLPLRKDAVIFGVRTLFDEKLIGSCQLSSINNVTRNAELQIRIGDFSMMNKGLGTEAVKLLLDYGFNKLNLKRIYLHVFATNERAINAYKKCGFRKEGVLREAAYINGRHIDANIMGILKREANGKSNCYSST